MAAGAASPPSQSKAPRAGAWAAECGMAASASEGKAKEDRRLRGRAKARGLKSKRAADRRAPRCKGACSTPRRFQDRFLTHGKLRTPGLQGAATTANPAPDNSVVCRRSGAAAGPGRKLRARAPGADPCEACSLPSVNCKMRCPAMLLINTTNFIYVVAASINRQRGDARVCVKPGRAPESTIGRKCGAQARQLSPECVCPGKSRDFEIAGGGAEKSGQPPSGCRIHGAPPVPPAHRRATAFNTWFLGRPEIFSSCASLPCGASVIDVTGPSEFIGVGAVDATKPYGFIGFEAVDVTKPYEFIGFGPRPQSGRLPPPQTLRLGGCRPQTPREEGPPQAQQPPKLMKFVTGSRFRPNRRQRSGFSRPVGTGRGAKFGRNRPKT